MCHLILLLPVITLPVLWWLPVGEGLVLYTFVLVVAGVVYWLVVKAMRAPVVTGVKTLVEKIGTVRSAEGCRGSIWVASELWSAESQDAPLAVGQTVRVIAVSGLRLIVTEAEPADRARAPVRFVVS